MRRRGREIRYRRNPPAPRRALQYGPKTLDAYGGYTYRDRLTEGPGGAMVDPRLGTLDSYDNKTDTEVKGRE